MKEKLREAIDNFCMREYGSGADFANLSRVPFLYTYVCGDELDDDGDPSDEIELQIYIDVENVRVIYCFGMMPGIVEDYTNEADMARDIEEANFDDWYSAAVTAGRYSGYYPKEWEFAD